MENKQKKYGFFGWKEFERSRKTILSEYDRAKDLSSSRPVKTEHGFAGEAVIRTWLSEFLPAKYGVTSGYIIPDLIMPDDYTLYHYDVIIFDKLNAPILFIDGNLDDSEQGRRRAIPAKYVHAVFESKANFTNTSIEQSISKLLELNSIPLLPENFSCGIVFFELDSGLAKNKILLPKLIPSTPIKGYWGGMILRCEINSEMTGLINLREVQDNDKEQKEEVLLVRDIDKFYIYKDATGVCCASAPAPGYSIMLGNPDNPAHINKVYGPTYFKGNYKINLSWSYNSFARFCSSLLLRLEGRPMADIGKYMFGQIFDKIYQQDESELKIS